LKAEALRGACQEKQIHADISPAKMVLDGSVMEVSFNPAMPGKSIFPFFPFLKLPVL
jgi:hypothetical protein